MKKTYVAPEMEKMLFFENVLGLSGNLSGVDPFVKDLYTDWN